MPPGGLSHDVVRSLSEDRAGNLWIGTKRGLDRIDAATRSLTRHLPRPEADDGYNSIGTTMHHLLEDLTARHQTTGRVRQNVEPWPTPSDSTQVLPPWTSTMRLTSARPMPVPSVRPSRRSNNRKTFSW